MREWAAVHPLPFQINENNDKLKTNEIMANKYSVSITRIGYAHRNIEVEADSELEAQEKAMDMAGDYDFSEGDADYECEGVMLLS